MNKHIKKWHELEFQKEVKILRDKFLDMCELWGWLFGGKGLIREGRCLFTVHEFPNFHLELKSDFEKVFNTLMLVATDWENDKFIVRPEINTIYTYHSRGKHDLVTPIIKVLARDCFEKLYAPFWENYAMNQLWHS